MEDNKEFMGGTTPVAEEHIPGTPETAPLEGSGPEPETVSAPAEEKKQAGKRLAPSEGKSSGGKKGLILLGAAAAALCAAYLGLCAWAGTGDRIMPGVTVNGQDLGGLTQAQATQVLRQTNSAAARHGVTLSYGNGRSVEVPADVAATDPEVTAWRAAAYGRQDGFLAQGYHALQSLISRTEIEPELQLSPEGEARLNEIVDGIAAELGGDLKETTWSQLGDHLVFRLGTPGIGVDRTSLRDEVLRMMKENGGTCVVTTTSTDPAGVDLTAIRQTIRTEVKEASLDKETYEVIDSVTGLDLDIDRAKAILEKAPWGTLATVPLAVTEPQLSGDDLRAMLFRDVLGENVAVSPGNSAQLNNIGLASAACDGTILLPGEIFSYNEVTGERDADHGYQSATVYKGGQTVVEVGGGVCFPSSTIYGAALNANLKIVKRQNHQFAVGYVPDGLDATVYAPVVDFQFENDTEYPIMISAKFDVRTLTVQILGTKTNDITVKMVNEVYDWIPAGVEYQLDPEMPAGAAPVEVQNAYNGRSATTYRNLYDGAGNLISSTLEAKSKYNMRNRILKISPADALAYGLAPDGTPMEVDPVTGLYIDPATGLPIQSADPGVEPTEPPAAPETPAEGDTPPAGIPTEPAPPAETEPPAEPQPPTDVPPAPEGPPEGIPIG